MSAPAGAAGPVPTPSVMSGSSGSGAPSLAPGLSRKIKKLLSVSLTGAGGDAASLHAALAALGDFYDVNSNDAEHRCDTVTTTLLP